MMNRYVTAMLSVLATAAPGCGKSNDPIDLGHHRPTSVGAKLSDYAGVWEGYAEAHTFDDGSDAVRLTLDPDGEGTIEVGASPPLPPPDPEHNYPHERSVGRFDLAPGFAYPIASTTVTEGRIRFTTYGMELFREWCALLTPHLYYGPGPRAGAGPRLESDVGSYSCWPLAGQMVQPLGDGLCRDTDDVTIPCGPIACDNVCQCTSTECAVTPLAWYVERGLNPVVRFDGALTSNGQKLDGTLVFHESGGLRVPLRLRKQ